MAHPDLEQILNASLPFAQQMLSKHGEFFPFGIAIDSDGQLQMYGADTGEERPPSQKMIDLIVSGFQSQAKTGKLKATGVCMDIRTIPPGATEKTDAFCIWLEHMNGEAVDVALPYSKSTTGEYEYGNLFAARGDHGIFARS